MFCKSCGASIEDNAKFCSACGATVEESAPTPEAVEAVSEPAPKSVKSAMPILILGIASVALIWWGISTPIALIVGIIALVLAKKYKKAGGEPCAKLTIGRILALISVIYGIVAMVIAVCAILFVIIMWGAGALLSIGTFLITALGMSASSGSFLIL